MIDHILPVIDGQNGPIPGVDGWHVSLMFPQSEQRAPDNGAAYFQISDEPGLSIRPAIIAHCCWQADLIGEVWQQTLASYYSLHDVLEATGMWREAPIEPPELPLVTEFHLPGLVAADAVTRQSLRTAVQAIAWGLVAA